jgi:hypothetical protein
VGCPIRRSRDQRSLASPPGFSQRATSFIASQCQGIHQMPFSALERHTQRQESHRVKPKLHRRTCHQSGKTLRRHFGRIRQSKGKTPSTRRFRRGHNSLLHNCPSTNAGPALLDRGPLLGHGKTVYPTAYRRASAGRPVKLRFDRGGGERNRTVDLLLAKQALSQLSYTPVQKTEAQKRRCGFSGVVI